MGLYITLMVFYSLSIKELINVDLDLIQYFANNDCSENVL